MTVSKRLRFEILRRDGHACRYCGQMAPDITLTIDHVVPVALGGKDEPANLVAACTGCNAGKSSINPDAPLVADVEMRAAAWAVAIDHIRIARANRREEIESDLERFEKAWDEWSYSENNERHTVPRAPDWMFTFEHWVTRGLEVDELIRHIPLAMRDYAGSAGAKRRLEHEGRWAYFCGIAWNLLSAFQDEVKAEADWLYEQENEAADDPFYGIGLDDDVAYLAGDQFFSVRLHEEAA